MCVGKKLLFDFTSTNVQSEVECSIACNGWGLTKFCLLPNLKNMRKPKGKILFKPLLGAVASTTVPTKREPFFIKTFLSVGNLLHF